MRTIEVTPEEWEQTLDAFSAIHQGGIASLDVLLGPALGFEFPIHDLPLRGVTAESDSHESTITISAAHGNGENITHIVHSPTHVYIDKTDEGADMALRIESGDGLAAILRFRTVALPDTAGRNVTKPS